MIFEICIDSIEGALAAQEAGAQRVELCDNLVEGGTTPSIGMIRLVRRSVTLGVHVIIRPRGGDFCFTELEFQAMQEDIRAARDAGANGVVIGILQPDGRIDRERSRQLMDMARPLSVTFHRAFDMTRDPYEALEDLISLGADRVLTSGTQETALAGADCIARLVRQAAGRIIILPGGGINAAILPELVRRTGVQEAHFSARSVLESPMQFRNTGCFMGSAYQPDEYRRKATNAELIRKIMDTVQ